MADALARSGALAYRHCPNRAGEISPLHDKPRPVLLFAPLRPGRIPSGPVTSLVTHEGSEFTSTTASRKLDGTYVAAYRMIIRSGNRKPRSTPPIKGRRGA
jgi:hypothetical protein